MHSVLITIIEGRSMKIEEYPGLIAKIQNQINANLEKCEGLKIQINEIIATIDRQIAFDDLLKNDQQRKSQRLELLSEDSDYASTLSILNKYDRQRKSLIVELERSQNEFAIAKLLKREAIALLESRDE